MSIAGGQGRQQLKKPLIRKMSGFFAVLKNLQSELR
jgi:hypothetical protein